MSMMHNTVYPKKYLVSSGNLSLGFTFHGPFSTHLKAMEWTLGNMHVGAEVRVVEMFDVREDSA